VSPQPCTIIAVNLLPRALFLTVRSLTTAFADRDWRAWQVDITT